MKCRIIPNVIWAGAIGLLLIRTIAGFSQTSAPADAAAPPSASTGDAINLSYGVADVLKLVRARVSDETIIAFIGKSGRIYNLTANEILYLRTEGVADRVLTAMLEQRHKQADAVAWTPPSNQASSDSSQLKAIPQTAEQSPATTQQPAPVYAPVAPVYVLRNPPPTYSYYDYYPYNPGYYRYPYPAVSFSFGFGSSYYHGGGYHYHGSHH